MVGLNKRYRQTAEAFAAILVDTLKDEVHSVVLYGSTARGRARRDSDIDILILAREPSAIRDRVVAIEVDLDAANNYETLLSSVYFDVDSFRRMAEWSPFARSVLEEGIVLYDDGSYIGVRDQVLAFSRPDAG
jgi:predicted nucleotidyltransferase